MSVVLGLKNDEWQSVTDKFVSMLYQLSTTPIPNRLSNVKKPIKKITKRVWIKGYHIINDGHFQEVGFQGSFPFYFTYIYALYIFYSKYLFIIKIIILFLQRKLRL